MTIVTIGIDLAKNVVAVHPKRATAPPATLRRSSSNDAISNGSRVSRKPGAIQLLVLIVSSLAARTAAVPGDSVMLTYIIMMFNK